MFSFIVSCLHFKSNILKGKLTEITPVINYYLSTVLTSLSKCFMQNFLTSTKFVSDLWQASGFLQVLRFPPPIKLTATV
jgi:hypothetical protein